MNLCSALHKSFFKALRYGPCVKGGHTVVIGMAAQLSNSLRSTELHRSRLRKVITVADTLIKFITFGRLVKYLEMPDAYCGTSHR